MYKTIIIGLFASLVLCGCPHRGSSIYNYFTVNSFSDKNMDKFSYCIKSRNNLDASKDLEFKEYAEYLRDAINSLGNTYIDNCEESQVIVYLSYGFGNPDSNGRNSIKIIPGNDRQDTMTTRGITSNLEFYSATTVKNKAYPKYMIVEAYKKHSLAGEENLTQLFSTTIANADGGDDFRSIAPLMVYALTPYMRTDTRSAKPITVSSVDYSKFRANKYISFVDNTVLDRRTGIMWAKNANLPGKALNNVDANNYVANLDYGGYRDWRLPTNEELNTIISLGGAIPAESLNAIGFEHVQYDYYWSSTNSDTPGQAWIHGTDTAYLYEVSKKRNYRIWPVRTTK